MSLLTERAPTSVQIGGSEYAFDGDFRNAIQFEMLMFDEDINDELKAPLALNLFYPETPANITAAFQAILWFYQGGAQIKQQKDGDGPRQRRIYSFEHDADYIFAAFLADYRIDLEETPFLHWWKFRALFLGLKPDNLICKIMEYRSADLGKLKGEDKKFYARMQKLYALPRLKSEQQKIDLLEQTLRSGGDLSTLAELQPDGGDTD